MNSPHSAAAEATLVIDARAQLGEGPVWDAGQEILYWVDIVGKALHSWDGSTARSRRYEEPVCAVSPEPGGSLLVAFAKRLARVSPCGDSITEVCPVEPDLPGNRCNDGRRDPAGRFWIGSMSVAGSVRGAGSLYCMAEHNRLERRLENLTISNGMGWSPDARTMYFIDSPTREVCAFDFDGADSSIRNRRVVVRVPERLGWPDGLDVAPDGTLWVGHWGAGCVCRWCPESGNLLERVTTGCPHTTSCSLTPDGSLYITTARDGLGEAELARSPHSGGVFLWSDAGAPIEVPVA